MRVAKHSCLVNQTPLNCERLKYILLKYYIFEANIFIILTLFDKNAVRNWHMGCSVTASVCVYETKRGKGEGEMGERGNNKTIFSI